MQKLLSLLIMVVVTMPAIAQTEKDSVPVSKATVADKKVKDDVYVVTEKMPQFPGWNGCSDEVPCG